MVQWPRGPVSGFSNYKITLFRNYLPSFEWTWTGTDASFGEGCYTKDEKVTEGILISPLNRSRETQYTPHDEKAGTNETPNWLRKSLKYVIKIEIALKEDNAKGNLLKNDTLLRGKKLCHCHILKEMSTMYIVSKRVIKRVVEIKTAQDVSMKLIFCKYIYIIRRLCNPEIHFCPTCFLIIYILSNFNFTSFFYCGILSNCVVFICKSVTLRFYRYRVLKTTGVKKNRRLCSGTLR